MPILSFFLLKTVPSTSVPQLYQRPSTLHGLKHKLHTGCVNSSSICPTSGTVKPLHNTAATPLSNRRKSVGHIPLSPLARTPSPSPLPSSPTRSPSPLAFPLLGHQPGSSNTTQSYSPGTSIPVVQTVSTVGKKGGFVRTKTSEPSSPLLRRALSPDRLHPRSAEAKCTLISPLCCSPPIKQPQRIIGSAWRAGGTTNNSYNNNSSCSPSPHNANSPVINILQSQQQPQRQQQQRQQQEQSQSQHLPYSNAFPHRLIESSESGVSATSNLIIGDGDSLANAVGNMCIDIAQGNQLVSTPTGGMALSVISSEMLPRIAEEKDSPTSISEGSATAFMNTIAENEVETEVEGLLSNSSKSGTCDTVPVAAAGIGADEKTEINVNNVNNVKTCKSQESKKN